MKRGLFLLFALAQVFNLCVSAQNVSKESPEKDELDIVFTDPLTGQFMSLSNKKKLRVLFVLDNTTVKADFRKLTTDTDLKSISKRDLSEIMGVKPKKIYAYRLLEGTQATQLWGMAGADGVVDVISKPMYRSLKKEGLHDSYQLVK